jgi:hypothetical protein
MAKRGGSILGCQACFHMLCCMDMEAQANRQPVISYPGHAGVL